MDLIIKRGKRERERERERGLGSGLVGKGESYLVAEERRDVST